MRSIKVFILCALAYSILHYGFGFFSEYSKVEGDGAGSDETIKSAHLDLREDAATQFAAQQIPEVSRAPFSKFEVKELPELPTPVRPNLDVAIPNVSLQDGLDKASAQKIKIYDWDIKNASDDELRNLINECTDKISMAANPKHNPTFQFAYYDADVLKAMISYGANSSMPFQDYYYNSRNSAFEYLKRYRHGYISFVIESTSNGFNGVDRFAAQYTCDIKAPGKMVVTRGLVHYFPN